MRSFFFISFSVVLCVLFCTIGFTIHHVLPENTQHFKLQKIQLRVHQLENRLLERSTFSSTPMRFQYPLLDVSRTALIHNVMLHKASDHLSPKLGNSGPVSQISSHLTCQNLTENAHVFRTATVKSRSGQYNISIHSVSDIVSQHILNTGNWEPFIESQMQVIFDKSWAAPDSLPGDSIPIDFIDIGGNIGHFSALAAHMGLRVLTVEPFGLNTPVILNTICKLNPSFSQLIRLHKVALTDKFGGDMCLWSTNTEINNGNARLTPFFEGRRDFDQDLGKKCMERIASFTLDHLLYVAEDGPHLKTRPRALKVDIEGFETLVFRGAKQFLSNHAPCFLFFEYQRIATMTTGAGEREIFEILQSAGYQIYVHVNNGKLSLDLSLCHGICDFSAALMKHESDCGPDLLKRLKV